MSTNDQSKKDLKSIQTTLLVLFGLFVILSTAFIGTYTGYVLFRSAIMAYVFGFSTMLLVGGILGWFTVIIHQAVQEVQIRVIQENQ